MLSIFFVAQFVPQIFSTVVDVASTVQSSSKHAIFCHFLRTSTKFRAYGTLFLLLFAKYLQKSIENYPILLYNRLV